MCAAPVAVGGGRRKGVATAMAGDRAQVGVCLSVGGGKKGTCVPHSPSDHPSPGALLVGGAR